MNKDNFTFSRLPFNSRPALQEGGSPNVEYSNRNRYNGVLRKRYDAAQNYGIGTHTETFNVERGLQLEVVYRISSVVEPLTLSQDVIDELSMPVFIQPDVPGIPDLNAPRILNRPPIPKLQDESRVDVNTLTPSALLSRASRLSDDHARLQAEALEIAAALDWKLSADKLPQLGKKERPGTRNPKTLRPQSKLKEQPRLIPRELTTPTKVLRIPNMPFLDRAMKGEGLATNLTPEARAGLHDLQNEVERVETRLVEINQDMEQLAPLLRAAADKATAAPWLTATQKRLTAQRLEAASVRLQDLSPVMPEYRALLDKQQQVIQRSLKQPDIDATLKKPMPIEPEVRPRVQPQIKRAF